MSDALGERWLKAHTVDIGLILRFCSALEELRIYWAQTGFDTWEDYSFVEPCISGIVLPTLHKVVLPTFSTEIAILAPALSSLEVVFEFGSGAQRPRFNNSPPSCLKTLNVEHLYFFDDDNPHVPLEAFNWLTRHSHDTLTTWSTFFSQSLHPSLQPFISLRDLTIELTRDGSDNDLWTMPSFQASLQSLPSSLKRLTVSDEYQTPEYGRIDQTFLVALLPRLEYLAVNSSLLPPPVWPLLVAQAHHYFPVMRELRLVDSRRYSDVEEAAMRVKGEQKGLKVVFA